MRSKLLAIITVLALMLSSNGYAMGSGGKPMLYWTPDGSGYWWYNNRNVPALCRLFYPNGAYYDFWLYPGLNTPVFLAWQQSDCNYY